MLRLLVFVLCCSVVLSACAGEGAPVATEPTTITAGEVRALAEAELPGRLLFSAGGDLWVWQGGAARRLTNEGHWYHPAFSRDGTRIAAIKREQSASDLYLLDAEGSAPIALTDNGSQQPLNSYERIYDTIWAWYPAWSPDDRQIVFASQFGTAEGSPASDYNLSLYRVAVAGGQREQLLVDEAAQLLNPSYAPDGRLAFDRIATGGDAAAQVQLYSDGAAAPFPGVPPESYDPAWSPDGTRLAFAARSDGVTDVFMVVVGAGEPLRVTRSGRARAPSFAPDGTWLAFIADGDDGFQLYAVQLDGQQTGLAVGEPIQLTAGLGIDVDSGLSWGP
jgi:TolB protein